MNYDDAPTMRLNRFKADVLREHGITFEPGDFYKDDDDTLQLVVLVYSYEKYVDVWSWLQSSADRLN